VDFDARKDKLTEKVQRKRLN